MNSQNNLTKHEKISHMCTEKLHMLFTPGGGGDLVLTMPECVCPKVKDMGPFLASRE